ncbi:hypothetical protein NKI04_17690 [Mesorhizobium sp. M0814]|uniref:hypothetical protein n=1 Tax=Mesorhizobium sp. M0814 TaxID=2957004 RepID=UPI0033364D48
MPEASEHAGMKGEIPIYPANMAESQSSVSPLCVGVNCSFDIPAAVKVDPGKGGMCVVLDTSGLRLAPTLLGGAVVGLCDDNSLSQ